MRKKLKRPETEQRRDEPSKVKIIAAVLFWLAQFTYIVLEIIKLWRELNG